MPPQGCYLALQATSFTLQRQQKPTDRVCSGCATLFLSLNFDVHKEKYLKRLLKSFGV